MARILSWKMRQRLPSCPNSHEFGYGAVTPGGREALDLLAKTEGILLDPVYTAKAMAGLIDDVRKRRVGPDEALVFIHTGGTPAVFAYRDELMAK